MKIFLGADHQGFALKETIKDYLVGKGYEVKDKGNTKLDPADDYPDFARTVAKSVATNPETRGILVCGSGAGVAIVANKEKGVRAATIMHPKQAFMVRNDEDVNVLALSADFTDISSAKEIVDIFLSTPFSTDARHKRRVSKIE